MFMREGRHGWVYRYGVTKRSWWSLLKIHALMFFGFQHSQCRWFIELINLEVFSFRSNSLSAEPHRNSQGHILALHLSFRCVCFLLLTQTSQIPASVRPRLAMVKIRFVTFRMRAVMPISGMPAILSASSKARLFIVSSINAGWNSAYAR